MKINTVDGLGRSGKGRINGTFQAVIIGEIGTAGTGNLVHFLRHFNTGTSRTNHIPRHESEHGRPNEKRKGA